MRKIAILGAGAISAPKQFVSDICSFPALADSTIALMDIHEGRLDLARDVAQRIVDNGGVPAAIEATTDLTVALRDADYVISTINVGGRDPFENEIRIPERYGVEQAIGDTLGPGGIFRAQRTIPELLTIAREMEAVCPDALLMNYSNPMAMNCWALDEETDIDVVGLCHSVQGTVREIARYTEITEDWDEAMEAIDYWVAGINHMAWFLECRHNGEDLYPRLHQAMEDPAIYEQDTVRFEVMKHFGAFSTESSHHLSEYLPYFRTDPDVIDAMTGVEDGMAGRMPTATYLEGWIDSQEHRYADADDATDLYDEDALTVKRSHEYPSRIIHSTETDTTRRLNLNVRNNTGAIANLADDACVEVPVLLDGTGIHPCSVGELPAQLAALNRSNIDVQRLAVRAALHGDRDALEHAVKLDPLSAAACTPDELQSMTDELLAANEEYLPQFSA